MKDYLGNEIKAGDIVVKPRAGDFHLYIIARITPKAVILLNEGTEWHTDNTNNIRNFKRIIKEYRTKSEQVIVATEQLKERFTHFHKIEIDYYNNNYKQKQTL